MTIEPRTITMLGTGLIGDFYTMTLHGQRNRDRVGAVYSRSAERGQAFSDRWGIANSTTSMVEAVNHPDTDVVVVGLPNHLHEEAIALSAAAGKPVLCTKPLARTAEEAKRILIRSKAPASLPDSWKICATPPRRSRRWRPSKEVLSAMSPGSVRGRRTRARTRLSSGTAG